MSAVKPCALPPDTLLEAYARRGAYTDCYVVELPLAVSHAEFVEAFYTTAVFKVERWLLGVFVSRSSTDAQAHELASGNLSSFAAWSVEGRAPNQLVLAFGRTRSWLMTAPGERLNGALTLLYFGSAIVPRRGGGRGLAGMGWQYRALLGFHDLYSRVLLWMASRRLASRGSARALA